MQGKEQDYKGQKGEVRVGELPDGRRVVNRDLSSDGRPTIEIQDRKGKTETEIRYDK